MGGITKREKNSKGRYKKLSSKRRSRRNAALGIRRKTKTKATDRESDVSLPSTSKSHLEAMASPASSVYSEERLTNSVIENSIETLPTDSVTIAEECEQEIHSESVPSGRRLIDIGELFKQLFNDVSQHEPFSCGIQNMFVVREVRKGLASSFLLKCKMCGIEKSLVSESGTAENSILDVNKAVTLACVSTGIGYSQFEEIAATLNLPMMASETFRSHEQQVMDIIHATAWKTMEEAGKEESDLAKQLGEVDKDGIPCITVITDGAWSKRAYNVNYDALSGVACIIGQRTGKLLYLGVRNKYCSVCARTAARNMEPTEHSCYRNWQGTSTGMESDIIAEGFSRSLELHGLKFTRLVGDGDSSVYRKLCEAKPYGNILIEKVECRNHLLRNFSTKIREVASKMTIIFSSGHIQGV